MLPSNSLRAVFKFLTSKRGPTGGHLAWWKKRPEERSAYRKILIQLEEDGGGSTRQSWMETSGS